MDLKLHYFAENVILEEVTLQYGLIVSGRMAWSSVIQSKSSYQEIYESNQIILLGTDLLMTLLCNYLVKVLVV